METLTKVKTVVFDKTGTLTNGRFTVTEIIPNGISKAELLRLTTTAEWYSNHPIAVSIKNEYGKEIDTANLTYIEEVAGCGVSLKVGGERILAGNEKLMKAHKIPFADIDSTGTKVYVAKGGKYLGCIVIADEIKADAKTAILSLKRNGIRRTIMLTGDSSQIGESVAKTIGIDEVYTELLPADKVEIFERLLDENRDGKIAFVCDGINDAPVLARADIGIAMGGVGSDASIEAADIVLMTDEPKKITDAIKIAKRTMGIVKQNIIFSLAVKTAVLLFGAVGFVNMWAAIFADVGVSVIAILNSMRALKYRAPK
jgi:Cd2+/Zn2+-exporting ATPase